jgi:hypothetical protein
VQLWFMLCIVVRYVLVKTDIFNVNVLHWRLVFRLTGNQPRLGDAISVILIESCHHN